MTYNQQISDQLSDNEKSHKIEMLRQMILNAEKTMQSAKAMLLQLEGKKKTGRKRKVEDDEEGTVVEGTFDGQLMIGSDGKQYPVPANYASKSKLVEGDVLKLTITDDGSFVYKQIGPAQRKSVIGIVSQDEKGNYFVFAEGRPYKVLLASITYFKAEPGDEIVMVIPREMDATWAAIENVISKGGMMEPSAEKTKKKFPADSSLNWKDDLKEEEAAGKTTEKKPSGDSVIDEWTSDIEDLEREISAQA